VKGWVREAMAGQGIVSLIGAGPGDPGLITVRGRECLLQADVVVYDRLVEPELLRAARPGAELIYVGKSAGHHALPQAEINALLVEKSRAGLQVARLKGGDPFVFGRGGEEAAALAAARIPFEVVPGVTSAVAAPAYAGIPVTHRDLASSFAVVTGHRRQDAEDGGELPASGSQDWAALARMDTLVILMGVSNLPAIVAQLLAAGRDPQTPVALVCRGTTPQQQVVDGCLADIVDRARETQVTPPAALIVGQVVALREKLRWFDTRPLFGRRVLVTRSPEQAGDLSARLRKLGAQPVEFPTIEIQPPESWEPLDAAIARLAEYDWVVFTSANGVRFFWQRLEQAGKDARVFGLARLAAIGPATAQELAGHGLQADLVPSRYVAECLLAEFGPVRGLRFLLPRTDVARPTLAEGLRAAGAAADEVVAYRTRPASARSGDELRRILVEGEVDVVTFTSSSTVRHFVAAMGPGACLPEGSTVACIGPVTACTARELGLRVDVVAEDYTLDGLVAALAKNPSQREPQ
jgi:uroporphyrinogen III methyltransferase/synthase